MPKKIQQLFAFGFGVVFVIVLLVLAIAFPNPTAFQYTVFRVVLALAVAGVAAMIPGFLEVTLSGWLRAGGALGVFVVVYFFSPIGLVLPEPDPTAPFHIILASEVNDQITVDRYSFPYSDIKKKSNFMDFTALVSQLPNQRCDQTSSVIFRIKDEVIITSDSSTTATSDGNLGVIIIPTEIVEELGGNHLAFTRIYAMVRSSLQ